jgi:hypothetical protein
MLHIINNAKIALFGVATVALLAACETTFYEDEQYRKEIYIVSGDNNIIGQEYSFGDESVGYLAIYAGGTTGIDTDVDVELEVYSDFLRNYNQRVFGDNYSNYGKELDPDYYSVESWKTTLKAGGNKPYVMFPIKVNVNNINIDESYYIPLRIKSVSDYMISEKKQNVLYRIFLKNDYATTKTTTYYTMNGTEQIFTETDGTFTPQGLPTVVNATKSFSPTGEFSIRMLPSTNYSTVASVVRDQSLNIVVYPEELIDVPVYVEGEFTGNYVKRQKVTLDTWQKSSTSVSVGEIDGEQSYYDAEKTTFYLNYRYKLSGETDWHFMHEVLKPLNITNQEKTGGN